MTRLLAGALGLLGMVSSALAQSANPVSSYIFPAGGQRGTTVEVAVGGEQLPPACDFLLEGRGVSAPPRLGPRPQARPVEPTPYRYPLFTGVTYPKAWSSQITIARDAPLGVVNYRLGTAQGGTHPRSFVIGDLPERIEAEPNSRADRAEPVSLPLTINGQFNPREDVDQYVFPLQAGEHIVLETAAARLAFPTDPVLEFYSPAGGLLATNNGAVEGDGRIAFTAPAAGDYRLAIHDAEYEGGPDYVYRLTIQAGPDVEYVFPPGGRRGTTVEVELEGSSAPSELATGGGAGSQRPTSQPAANESRVATAGVQASAGAARTRRVELPADPGARVAMVHIPGLAAPMVMALGDSKEVMEGTAGRDAAGAKPTATASTVNSQPSSVADAGDVSSAANWVEPPCTINGRAGQVGDRDYFAFTAKKGTRIAIECLARQLGSPLKAALRLVGPKGQVVASASALATDPDDPRMEMTIPEDGRYTVEIADVHRLVRGGPEFFYRLTIAQPEPDFALKLGKDYADLAPGGKVDVDLTVERRGGFDASVKLSFAGLPRGATVAPEKIDGGQASVKLSFAAAKNAQIIPALVEITGTATVAGREVRRVAQASYPAAPAPTLGPKSTVDKLLLTVTHPPLFSIEADDTFYVTHKGTIWPAKFKVKREPGFKGELLVRIGDRQIRELDGFGVPETRVPPDATEFVLPCRLPDSMELSRPSNRVYTLATAMVKDADGREQHLLAASPKQIVVKCIYPLVELSSRQPELEVARGTTVQLDLDLHRVATYPEPMEIRLVPAERMRGITAEPIRVERGATSARIAVHFAADAGLGNNSAINLRATGLYKDSPVEANARVEVRWR